MHASVEAQGREMNEPSELNDAANRTFQVWKEQEQKKKWKLCKLWGSLEKLTNQFTVGLGLENQERIPLIMICLPLQNTNEMLGARMCFVQDTFCLAVGTPLNAQ